MFNAVTDHHHHCHTQTRHAQLTIFTGTLECFSHSLNASFSSVSASCKLYTKKSETKKRRIV